MSRFVPPRVQRVFALAVAWCVGFSLVGCENQLSKRLADRLPQVSGEPVQGDGTVDPAVTVTVDAGSWKRFCSVCLLNTSSEDRADDEKARDTRADEKEPEGKRPRKTSLPDVVLKFKRLHDEIPPEVVKAMSAHNVRNYSIHVGRISGDYYAVRYFEYAGSNPDVDLTLLARDSAYQKWQEACDACQVVLLPISNSPLGPFMEEIFHNELRPPAKVVRPSELPSVPAPSRR